MEFAGLRSEFGELRSEFVELRSEFAGGRLEFAGLRSEFALLRSETTSGLAAVNSRLDRLFLALLAGLFVVVASMVGVVFTVL